jgi:ferredoxin--NADP+ reductase
VFVAGWSREASSGLVGVARKDGENGASAVLEFLKTAPNLVNPNSVLDEFIGKQKTFNKPIIQKSNLKDLAEAEAVEAAKLGLPAFKYATNEEMLAAMGLN